MKEKAKILVLVLVFVLLCVVSGQAQADSCQVVDHTNFWWHACMVVGEERPDYVPEWAEAQLFNCDGVVGCYVIYTWSVLKNPVYLPLILGGE